MKERKLLGKESHAEEEKTKIQQIEENVKSSIFSVFYLLLKNQETTFWKFIILFIIEYLQLLSFSFDESMVTQWYYKDVVSYFSQFLCTFRIVYWLKKLNWEIYVIIFYIIIFLIFVIIIDFLYVAISFKHKRYSFMQPIQILRVASMLISTVLYIPIIEFFFVISQCEKGADGTISHIRFGEEVECFNSIHILHAAVSYIMFFVFFAIVLMAILMHFESRYTKDPTSKINAKTDMLQLFSKTIYVFVYTFFSQETYNLFKTIVLCVFSLIVMLSYFNIKPYFNSTTKIMAEMFSSVFVWTNLVLLFSQLLEDVAFNGALQIYFLGIPIICILVYTRQEDRLHLLMQPEAQLQQGIQSQKKNYFYLNIIETKESDRQSAIILKGYINHHVEVCLVDTCPIKQFKRLLQRDNMNMENDRKKKFAGGKVSAISSENNSLLLAQAKALYSNGIKKFPKYTALRIDYANFLQSKMKDRKGALNELSKAEKLKPGLDHQFLIYRQRKIIEDELAEGQELGGIDFIAALNFENQFKNFKQLIEKSAMLHYEFWNHLLDDSPDLVRLSQQGAKINSSITGVEEQWKRLAKMSTNTPKALKLYASYLIEILNDKETGNEQMIKAKEAANLRVNFEFNNVNEDFSDLNNFAQDGTPCIYISGEQERLGIVNQCNMSLCKIFGYTRREDIVNKDVEMLMPKTYSENHKDFLTVSNQKSADQISSRERQVFGKHFSGYIFPLWLQIKNLPSLLSGRQYVATFKVEKTGINKNVAHIIFNKNKEIMDISASCIQMLGISFEKLHKKIVYYDVKSLLPQLFLNNQQIYQNKAGAHITYYFPKIVENEQKKEVEEQQDNDSKEDLSAQDDNFQTEKAGSQDFFDDGEQQDVSSFSVAKRKVANNKNSSKKESDTEEAKDEDNEANHVYPYKAIANQEKSVQFQCNLTEIYFELIGQLGGYHIRLESSQDKQIVGRVQKQVKNQAFQFSYDPVFKRFVRELKDTDNKDYLLDKNFLALKQIREQNKNPQTTVTPDGEVVESRVKNMSYISYLNKQQRLANKNSNINGDEDDDINQSEESSVDSGAGKKMSDNKKAEASNTGQLQIPSNADYLKQFIAGEGYGKEFLRGELERLIRYLQDKQKAGAGVHTFIRVDNNKKWEESHTQAAGLFSDKSGEIPKLDEEEEEQEQKEGEKEKDGDSLKTSIKSKKAFSMAINDRTMPPAIKRLSRTAQIIISFLIALAIAEYALVYKQFTETKTNFILIEKSFERTAEIQKVVFNARTLILINQGILTNYGKYTTSTDLVTFIKSEFSKSLDTLYSIQNEINLSQLDVSPETDALLNTKSVNLYFKEDASSMKALQFSLTESILQISSTIFTVSNLNINNFNETNEDVFFLMYNSFNDFSMALKQASTLYTTQLMDRAADKEKTCMIIFILTVIILSLCVLILIPVVHSVNQQKDKVLSLFCEIDNNCIRVLSLRCERFMNNMQTEEGNDEIDSNEDIENNFQNDEDDEYNLLSGTGKKIKRSKGKTKTDKAFFLKFIMALLLIQAYYLANFLLYKKSIKTTQILGSELNVTCYTEPYYWFSLNTQREIFFNPNKKINNQTDTFAIAQSSITNLYEHNNNLQEMHLDHQANVDKDYWNQFENIMRNDLCPQIKYFDNQANCQAFISGTFTQGMHTTLIRYFETLRTQLDSYQEFKLASNTTGIRSLFNNQSMQELYVIQNFVTQPFMRQLVQSLGDSIQKEYNFQVQQRIAIFIVFLIAILIAFFLFWLPFLNGLNLQIYKTKLMLMIIPLEILMKIKNIGKVLQSQAFLTNNNSKKTTKEE